MSKPEKLFIEQHERGWAVKQENAERASAVKRTQAEAIARAEEINPNAELRSHRDEIRGSFLYTIH
jgi:uncharacterized protein YdaT